MNMNNLLEDQRKDELCLREKKKLLSLVMANLYAAHATFCCLSNYSEKSI